MPKTSAKTKKTTLYRAIPNAYIYHVQIRSSQSYRSMTSKPKAVDLAMDFIRDGYPTTIRAGRRSVHADSFSVNVL